MKEKMTYLDVLEETINFYTVDPVNRRSVDISNGNCFYSYEGKNCAFARYMDDVDNFIKKYPLYNHETARTIIKTFGMDVMKKQVRNLTDLQFWGKIQILHDDEYYWNETGLSEDGIEYANEIKELIKSINE